MTAGLRSWFGKYHYCSEYLSERTENPTVRVCYFGLFSHESLVIKDTELTSRNSAVQIGMQSPLIIIFDLLKGPKGY